MLHNAHVETFYRFKSWISEIYHYPWSEMLYLGDAYREIKNREKSNAD